MELTLEKIKEMTDLVNNNCIVYECDDKLGLRPIMVTERTARLFGYAKEEYEEYLNTHSMTEVWGFDIEYMQSRINRHLIDGADTTYTVQMPHRTEGFIWIRVKSRIIGEMNGRAVLLIELINADDVARSVTGLVDRSSRCIYVIDKESHKLLYVNETFRRWTKKSNAELLGKNCYAVCTNCSEETGNLCYHCIPLQAYNNGGKIEYEGKDADSFYSAECVQIKWGGHDAYAVTMADITAQKQIEKERLEKHYHRMDMPVNYMAGQRDAYFINLTENTGFLINDEENSEDRCTFDELVQDILEHVSSVSDRKNISEILDRERLLQNFRNGQISDTVECRYALNEDRDMHMRYTVCMSQNPLTRDVECVLYQEDISVPYLLGKVSEFVMDEAYLGLAVVDLAHEKFIPIDKQEGGANSLTAVLDYEPALKGGAKENIIPDERQMFTTCAGINNLKKQLAQKDTYFMMVHGYNEDGGINYARYSYSYLNRERGIAVCAMEDMTADFEIDHLTGLYNYDGFAIRAQEILRRKDKEYAVLFYNIKGFKAVNELFGNKAGDNVLKEVTKNLQHSSMNIKLLGRIAVTDHFLILVEQKDVDYNEVKRLCSLTMSIDDRKVAIHGRCGITYVSDRMLPIDRICDQAKLAKMHIEDAYVKPYAVFDEEMRETYLFKTNAISIACQALENNEFCVYYQPIYDARTGRIASAEALVRWNRPDVGMISPGMFVPALEESGYISLVDTFVARSVRHFQERRLAEGKKAVPVSVNLSWIDFYDDKTISSVMEDIQMMSDRQDVSKLRYEVTETSWAAMNSKSSPMLQDMKKRGVKILLDDFGSGFSSFSTIRDYDFDILKIDMGFVQKLGMSEKVDGIVHAIIEMAHHIRADVVAEGVETEEQRRFLAENNCDYLQGYLFSKPLPEDEFIALLDAEERKVHMSYEDALKKCTSAGQKHVLKYYDELTDGQKELLLEQIDATDFSVLECLKNKGKEGKKGKVSPLKAMQIPEIMEKADHYRDIGLDAVKAGKVGAVLLAGGMGTRLGSEEPKGMYDIGLTKEVYIFQRLIENMMDVVTLTGTYFPLYIMTSDRNHSATVRFLREKNYFGYPAEQVFFFKQDMAPAYDYQGRVYMEEKYKMSTSPNGNGGWFVSMERSGILKKVHEAGVEWLNVFAVDNVLQRICDPVFVGATIEQGVDVGAKVVRKNDPDERVGVMCLEDGRPSIVEYYELTDELRNTMDENGEPAYNFGVILNYLFKVSALEDMMRKKLPLHVVEKKIPYINEQGVRCKPEKPNGYKFEQLVLDMIRELGSCLPFEVVRNREFAPIKNETGVDSVESARKLCLENGIEL